MNKNIVAYFPWIMLFSPSKPFLAWHTWVDGSSCSSGSLAVLSPRHVWLQILDSHPKGSFFVPCSTNDKNN